MNQNNNGEVATHKSTPDFYFDFSTGGVIEIEIDMVIDCCECGYFYATTMSYPSGKCTLLDEGCGLGCYCELFCKRDDRPTMDTRVVGNMKDVKKLAVQFEMLLKEKDGEENE